MSTFGLMKRSSRRAPAGFTLIELLVVIGILLLLVGLLAPSVTGVLSQFRSGSCRSNLRTLFNYVKAYTTDSGGIFPALGKKTGLVDAEWVRGISTYNKHPGVLLCPVGKDPNPGYKVNDSYWAGGTEYAWKTTMEPARTGWTSDPVIGSFAYNLWLSSVWPGWTYKTTFGLDVPGGLYHKFWEKDGTAEEDTPVLTDGYWMGALPYVGAGNTIRTQEDVFGQYKGGMDICSLRRHSKRHSNVVLINGSCQELDIREELWKLPWHRDYLKPYGSNIELARPDACKPQNSGDRPWLFD